MFLNFKRLRDDTQLRTSLGVVCYSVHVLCSASSGSSMDCSWIVSHSCSLQFSKLQSCISPSFSHTPTSSPQHTHTHTVHKARIHSRSDSASSVNSLTITDTSLKKLLKDLHRCDISITRYQAMLTEVSK